jgi:DNA-binding beta-propeller fold protein YncE
MLALIYLALAIYLGDVLCRRFYRFVSFAHRCAAAVFTGLLVSTWFTYLAGLAFASWRQPLLWANALFFVAAILVISWPRWKGKIVNTDNRSAVSLYLSRSKGSNWADWVFIVGYVILVSWMMFASFSSTGSRLRISNPEYSDFGPNTAIMQSFAVGHNFPTEYPHFSGDRIRYHFLFYFQAGNLEFLGLDPAWSVNLLSIITIVAMLVLAMTLGEVLFDSRTVGRLGSALFFFFGSLSYIPFLHKQGSVRNAIHTVRNLQEFLPTIFPYRGEAWGTWSQVTFLNQRHFASAIGVLLLVLIFLVISYRALRVKQTKPRRPSTEPSAPAGSMAQPESSPERGTNSVQTASEEKAPAVTATAGETKFFNDVTFESFHAKTAAFIFSGALLGLLPMWNSAVFVAGAAVLAVLFVLCPLRPQMLALAIAAGLVALPQMLYLSTGSGRAQMPKLLHWGYTLDHPTVWNVTKYLGFTFGIKWLLIALALILASGLPRRVFAAISSLLVVAFSFQFTIEVLANQKFLHIWVIIANLFVAYGLWRLWRFSLLGTTLPGKLVSVALTLAIIPGGLIEFFPIHNTYWSEVTFRNDPLIDWLNKNTTPRDIFLTTRFVNHPILMAGRRVFYGWPYYSWGAGYDSSKRDRAYLDLFQTKDPRKLFRLLKENNIAYVAFDDGVRHRDFVKSPNEQVYARYFPKVFQEHKYDLLTIYKIPETPPSQLKSLPEVGTNMFEGEKGPGKGQFDFPRGMAIDRAGNVLIADTNNGRVQKFSPDGVFLSVIGTKGEGLGEFREPCGVAADSSGNIYVADTGNQRVQKLDRSGNFIAEWKGPEQGFYGPCDISIGTDNAVYVVDEGHARIVKLDTDGNLLAVWGERGTGDGQFDDPTSVAVDANNNRVYVADPKNRRIQVFDTNGQFVASWPVAQWRIIPNAWYMQHLVVDSKAGRLYATSTQTDEVLVFNLNGLRITSLVPRPPAKLEGASALAITNKKLYVLCTFGDRVTEIDLGGR